jgi:hypothetical protein
MFRFHLQSKKICSVFCLLHAAFLRGLPVYPEDGGDFLPKQRLTFTGLLDVTSQMAELSVRLLYRQEMYL